MLRVTEMRPLSLFVDDPSDAGREIQPCLDKARDVIPADQYSTTPVFLGATGGMRMLQYAWQTNFLKL